MRPFKLWVVVGQTLFVSVPKSTLRRNLNKSGRVKKLEFRRSLTGLQVQSRIVQALPFMKCVDLNKVTVDVEGGGYPNGSVLQSIASKESLYMVESSETPKVDSICQCQHVTFILL